MPINLVVHLVASPCRKKWTGSNLVEKAKQRSEQVRQVVDTLRKQGVTQTYRAVMKKLEAYSPLGYSSAGTVVGVGGGGSHGGTEDTERGNGFDRTSFSDLPSAGYLRALRVSV